MIINKETTYTKDTANKKMKVVREFDASADKVWRAWTEPALLDQWWAPKPWKANTISMDLHNGGKWFYYMEVPAGERHYCIVQYESITSGKVFTGTDAFADEKGNINTEFPTFKNVKTYNNFQTFKIFQFQNFQTSKFPKLQNFKNF